MGSICSLNITHNTGSARDSEILAVLLPLAALGERIVRDNPSGVWSRNSMLNSSIIRTALTDDLPPRRSRHNVGLCTEKRGDLSGQKEPHTRPLQKPKLTSAEIWLTVPLRGSVFCFLGHQMGKMKSSAKPGYVAESKHLFLSKRYL